MKCILSMSVYIHLRRLRIGEDSLKGDDIDGCFYILFYFYIISSMHSRPLVPRQTWHLTCYYFDTSDVIMKILNTNHPGASAAMPAASSPSRSSDIPNINNASRQLWLASRGYQIILWRPSLVVSDVGPLRKARGFLKHSTGRIAYRHVFTLALDGFLYI